MIPRPDSLADACVSAGLIHIMPHTNDKVRVSQPRPSDFHRGAQMIPQRPCHHLNLCTPANESVADGEIEKHLGASTIQRRISRVYLESWSDGFAGGGG